MKITATSGGGFAGLSEHYEIDTQASANGKALEAAIAAAGFFTSALDATPDIVGADLVRWNITVCADARQHTVSVAEDGAGPRWQHLLALIRSA